MTDYMTSAASSTANTSALTSVPNVTQALLNTFFQTANAGDQSNTRDDAGLPIVYGSCKLLDMLGYGSMIASTNAGKAAITKKYLGVGTLGDADNPLVYQTSQTVNALPFLAYQKIYQDFFRWSQWENADPTSYNFDWYQGFGNLFGGTIDTPLPANSDYWKRDNLFSLRYCNWNKDLFMGILPNSQFGDISDIVTGKQIGRAHV